MMHTHMDSAAVMAPLNQDFTKLSLEELLNVEITPINVLGSHTHLRGEKMIGYRYMWSDMGRNRMGTRDITPDDVLKKYPVAHTGMVMQMHMIDLMYAPTNELSLMVMLPYIQMSMDHINQSGVRFTTHSEGIGDTTLMGLWTFKGDPRQKGNRFVLNTGISLPTGSTSKRAATPSNPSAKLEYEMQLGSGTIDLLPGITYLGESDIWTWGAQFMPVVRLGTNSAHYRLGNEQRVSAWGHYKVSDAIGPSLRLRYLHRDNISGADAELNPATNSAFDPSQQATQRLDLFAGLNIYVPRGKWKGQRLTFEIGHPIYQNVTGIQLGTYWQYNLGWTCTLR